MGWVLVIAAHLVSVALAASAHAALVIGVVEESGDVKFRFSGSLDLSGAVLLDTGRADTREQGFLGPRDGSFVNLPLLPFSDGTRPYDVYQGGRLPSFGALTPLRGRARGTAFGITASGRILVPEGYVSGAPLSGEVVFFGRTLKSLALATGTFSTGFGPGDGQITLTIPSVDESTGDPVPAPAAALLFLTGGAIILARRRRQSFLRR